MRQRKLEILILICPVREPVAEMQHALTLTQAKVVISEPDRIGTAMAAYPGVPHVVLTGQPPDGAKTFLNILRMGEATQPRPDPDTYRAVELGDRSQHAPVILFSSGTTGMPKAVMLRDSSLTLTLANTSAGSSVDEGKASDAMLLLTSPLCWFSGVMNLFWSLQTGSTRVFITHSDDLAVLSAIDKYKITIWVTAPPMLFTGTAFYKSKSNPGYRLDSLATIFVGGSGLNAQLEESIEQDVDCRIVQAYASTETGFICSRSRLKSSASPHGVLGTLSPGVEFRLVDVDTGEDIPTDVKNAVGEARIRSKYVMLRYCNNPEETKRAFDEHGFYKTGDLLYENDEGSYVFVDRMKEVIKYKNNPISPAELEMVLLQHSGVKEACVLGRACTASGELPTAFVSRADNAAGASLTEDELRAMVAEKLADYKRLRGGVIFLDQLPRTVSGKTDRRNLKEMLQKIKE
ncbi:uncharacterized protein LOC113215551 isoform X1 [Frankliniella occidentalis]|uniref:Uncharacterized protein LOC113215551 isoform X1 n=1 Tax=Frankliniella occidentalis TaxID=133901 RepID=A0A6J1TCF0_FRAOC|nr:uncharacterized protein LOC113215551 isoform X1 [Frankliniella occidentalis]